MKRCNYCKDPGSLWARNQRALEKHRNNSPLDNPLDILVVCDTHEYVPVNRGYSVIEE